MPIVPVEGRKRSNLARLIGATALACIFAAAGTNTVWAQVTEVMAAEVPANSQMLLEADTLIYDNDNNIVTADGSVQIDYGGNKLVAQRVVYNRKTGRLVASGDVEIVDSSGTQVYSDELDITDDFANGFVNALRVETIDKTYFAAESAERNAGTTTTFNNGVYTACEPCEDKPDKAPIWRIKAQKIIWNGKEKTVRFEHSRFEFFGMPIAYFPVMEVPDPTVKRKTGFLIPGVNYNSDLGVGVTVPYYFALSPTYDLTLKDRYYCEARLPWRGRVAATLQQWLLQPQGRRHQPAGSGGIRGQQRKFGHGGRPQPHGAAWSVSKGVFNINPRWTFGWDVLVQSDKDFSNTYNINGFSQPVHQSEVYLTGLTGRNYFDLQRHALRGAGRPPRDQPHRALRQAALGAAVASTIPTRRTSRWQAASWRSTSTRESSCAKSWTPCRACRWCAVSRARTAASPPKPNGRNRSSPTGGMVITPLLGVRGDASYADMSDSSVAAIDAMATTLGVGSDVRAELYRWMATAGLEWRWPVLFSSTSSTHILEPMAQVFARPDEQYIGELGIPNEDAQSFVFDAGTLFERDKFSGYDRMEGGTRANLGLRYSGAYGSGWTTNAILGQSYQIGGVNSFAAPDLVNVGAYSGLETPTSDYVGLFGFATPFGLSSSVSARLDEQTFEVRRTELKAGWSGQPVSLIGKYAFIQAQPLYGFPEDRHEVTLGGICPHAGVLARVRVGHL